MLELNGPRISACNWDPPECVEVALRYRNRAWPLQHLFGPRLVIEVTDSKLDDSPVHVMGLGTWDRFLRHLDDWRPDARGEYRLGVLRFTRDEVDRFVDRVGAGDFHRSLAAAT